MLMSVQSARMCARGGGGLAIAMLLSACASVPHTEPLAVIKPTGHYDTAQSFSSASVAAQWPASDWWAAYGDSQLDALMAEALAGSPDLAAAVARVQRADAYAQAAGAARFPSVDGAGGPSVTKQSYNNGIPADFVPQGWNDAASISATFGFDLDLWGKNRAAFAAARSDAEAARLDYQQTVILLSTNVADSYAELSRLFALRNVQVAALDMRQKAARLVDDRVRSGLDTQAELRQANAAIPAARSDLAATDEQIAITRNRIAALLGQGPDRGLSITAPAVQVMARGIPAGVTTNLIGRRPDIVAARTRVEAEAERIKVARAGFYPSVNLGAVIGLQSLGLGNLLKSGSTFGNAGPAVSLPIFGGGMVAGQYRGARASYDEAVAQYDSTVAQAWRAVADAVASQRAVDMQLAESRQSLADYEAAEAIAELRYAGGLSTFLEVLTAQERALQARQIVTALQSRAFALDIALVRALGGGFDANVTAAGGHQAKDDKHG